MRRLLAPLVIASCLLAPSAAIAQDADKQAEALFAEGLAAKESGDQETACKKFLESFDLSGKIGPLLNLAECEERRGHPATALSRWKRGLALLQEKGSDKRIATVQDRIKSLEKVVPRLTVKLAEGVPQGTVVRIDGQRIEMPSGPVPVDPGERVVTASAPEHEEGRVTVTLVELDRKEVTVAPGPKTDAKSGGGGGESGAGGAGGAGGKGGGGQGPGGEEPGGGQRMAGFVIGGLGIAGLAASGVTGILTLQKHNQLEEPGVCDANRICTPDGVAAASDGKTLALINTVALGAGVGLTALGAVLIATSGGKKKAPEAAAVVAPLPGGAFMVLRTSF